MDKFQATPSEELTRLRGVSAQKFGDLPLKEAVCLLEKLGGSKALDQLRQRLAGQMKRHCRGLCQEENGRR